MSQNQPPPGQSGITRQAAFEWLYVIVNVYAVAFLPFLRYGGGTRAVGPAGLFAWLAMLLYAGHTASPEMLIYIKAWLVFVVYRRFFDSDRRRHTGFQGWPYTGLLIRRRPRLARLAECLAVYLTGSMLSAWSEPVGRFVAGGAYALLVKLGIDIAVQRQEDEDAANAVAEMESRMLRMDAVRRTRS